MKNFSVQKRYFIAVLFLVIFSMIASQIFFSGPSQRLLISTKGCRIQDFDAINEDIKEYFYKEDINCDKNNMKQLVKGTTSELYVDESRLKVYNCSRETLKCCFRPFWKIHVERKVRDYDDYWEFSKECFQFFDPMEVLHEFVQVSCTNGSKTIYKDYFAFVQRRKDIKQSDSNDRSKVSVLTFGLDGVSRLNLHRHLPKTVGLLQDLGAVEMLGYNKVGDNTLPNLIPVLTGLSSDQLKQLCWPNDTLDECPFIWNDYHEKGYQTGYGEDSHKIMLFNLHSAGFKKKPTDFYMTPFTKAAEKDIGRGGRGICNICLGKRLIFESLLDTVRRFCFVLKNIPSFGFFWSNSLSHDFLNLPQHVDTPFFHFLNELNQSRVLEKTVVVFMSDHGIRIGKYRQRTYQGYVEERLPFLFILYPKWFKIEFPQAVLNLKRNRRRLTSPYDLHETYKNLLDLKSLKLKRTPMKERTSLFSPISEERTCADAGIPFEWCTCNKFSTPEMLNDSKVLTSGLLLVHHLNYLLSNYERCAKLNMSSIISARSEESEDKSVIDYTIGVETLPGKNYFQGTVRHSNFNFKLLPPVSRINTYGNQSDCIADAKLKLYCYCIY